MTEPKTTQKFRESVARYNAEHYYRLVIRVPKGMKDELKDKTDSINGLVNSLLTEWLSKNK